MSQIFLGDRTDSGANVSATHITMIAGATTDLFRAVSAYQSVNPRHKRIVSGEAEISRALFPMHSRRVTTSFQISHMPTPPFHRPFPAVALTRPRRAKVRLATETQSLLIPLFSFFGVRLALGHTDLLGILLPVVDVRRSVYSISYASSRPINSTHMSRTRCRDPPSCPRPR